MELIEKFLAAAGESCFDKGTGRPGVYIRLVLLTGGASVICDNKILYEHYQQAGFPPIREKPACWEQSWFLPPH
ncbi:MAG TPA: hypothetical protein VFS21_23365 [Roseiflexaceae bacterium]|nr:hypothetical protein [Roseiflexaceae bacterium]